MEDNKTLSPEITQQSVVDDPSRLTEDDIEKAKELIKSHDMRVYEGISNNFRSVLLKCVSASISKHKYNKLVDKAYFIIAESINKLDQNRESVEKKIIFLNSLKESLHNTWILNNNKSMKENRKKHRVRNFLGL